MNFWQKIVTGLTVILAAVFLAASPVFSQSINSTLAQNPGSLTSPTRQTVRILSREASKSLNLTRIPTTEPTALLVGSYWECTGEGVFETCNHFVVVCNDSQTSCASTN